MLLTAQKTVFREVIDDRRLSIREQICAFKFLFHTRFLWLIIVEYLDILLH